jgi:uncharacterized integral membrane protein
MWLLKSFFMILVIALGLAFAFLNFDQRVTLNFLPGQRALLTDVPVVYALVAAFLLGVVVWYLASFFHILRIHLRMGEVRKETARLEAELTALRAREHEVEHEVEEVVEHTGFDPRTHRPRIVPGKEKK